MGTYIDVYLTHSLPSWRDAAATLACLSEAEVASRAVAQYWRTVQPFDRDREHWEIDERLPEYLSYHGPGSLHLDVTPMAARLHTGGRWRGFLSIPPLRHVHLAAFRAIADAFSSPRMAVTHDSIDGLLDAFLEGAPQEQLIRMLETSLGQPQPSLDAVEPWIAAQAERGVPDVWYLETRLGTAEAGVAG